MAGMLRKMKARAERLLLNDHGIFRHLKRDHARLSTQLDELVKLGEHDPRRLARFRSLRRALLAHERAETMVLYPALRDRDETRPMASAIQREHDHIDRLVEEVTRASSYPEWSACLDELRRTVAQHFRDEEEELFPRAQAVLDDDQAEGLARSFEHERDAFAQMFG
jgi:hemerythrin superfamily protein